MAIWNGIKIADAVEAIGETGWRQIQELRARVEPDVHDPFSVRYAPSMVGRSVVELFGLSMPRFAARVYLKGRRGSFVNARRTQVFKGQQPRFARRRLKALNPHALPGVSEAIGAEDPDVAAERQPCIADCYLLKPKYLGGFDLLQARLANAYGESLTDIENVGGTPFVRTIDVLGGGLCAQACCFMATVLLHEYSNGIHGLAEITRLAEHERDLRELSLSGLNPASVSKYFDKVGLHSELQTVIPPGVKKRSEDGLLKAALRAYLKSGFPVIVPVDLGRLFGVATTKSGKEELNRVGFVYGRPENHEKAHPDVVNNRKPRNHAVLVVGYNDKTGDFLLNDPSVKPFVLANAAQIVAAAPYLKNARGIEKSSFAPVTPKEVRLRLCVRHTNTGYLNGLFDDADCLQSGLCEEIGCPNVDPNYQFEHLYLMRVRDLQKRTKELLARTRFSIYSPKRRASLAGKVRSMSINLVSRLNRGRENWIWVQFTPDSVWVYDAECEWPPVPGTRGSDSVTYQVRAILTWTGSKGWEAKLFGHPLTLSLITSCSAASMKEVIKRWPSTVRFAELYTFMQNDCIDLVCGGRKLEKFAVGMMAKLKDDLPRIKKAAARIAAEFSAMGVEVIAFATFIPELVLVGERKRREQAKDALIFLMRLARELQKKGHRVRTVEMVGGSLIGGVWLGYKDGPDGAENMYVANIETRRAGLRRLVKRLVPIAEEACRCESYVSSKRKRLRTEAITLALEMEPGPLFILGDLGQLREFVRMVEEDPVLTKVVGLNLDIPHWGILGRIPVEQVRADPRLFQRIVHAHISDHAQGHFGDNVLGAINPLDEFENWVGLLKERHQMLPDDSRLPFSGYVSMELEACKAASMINICATRARMLGIM
ncbi:MAG: hypothetical protein C5B50_17670 [Verrucomicrobia bacterium]|nr:MAG: hypothetical protein C5B50_17670 [Verrucomicrobiota bacterium]